MQTPSSKKKKKKKSCKHKQQAPEQAAIGQTYTKELKTKGEKKPIKQNNEQTLNYTSTDRQTETMY